MQDIVGSTVYGKVNKLSNIHYYVQYAVVGERIFSFSSEISGMFSGPQQLRIGFLKPASFPKSLMIRVVSVITNPRNYA